MTGLAAAAAFFVVLHVGVAGSPMRSALVQRIGERAYLCLFSLASAVGLVGLVMAYRAAFASGNVMVWDLGPGTKHAAGPVMLVACFFVVVGLLSPSPTAVMQGALVEKSPEPRGIQRITRHPFLWGVVIWSSLHLAANGDRASILLFGALFVVALLGTFSIDRKRARAHGAAWETYAAHTSNVPFVAVATRRTKLRLGELAWWRVLLVLVVFGALVSIHPWLFGAYPLPGMDD